MFSATGILSPSTVKRLFMEQGRFLNREQRNSSCKFLQNCKVRVFVLNLRFANCKLNIELQFSKCFSELSFETESC